MKLHRIFAWTTKFTMLVLIITVIYGLYYFYLVPLPTIEAPSQLFVSDLESCNPSSSKGQGNIRLEVSPKISNIDDSVHISVIGLNPRQVGTLKLSVLDAKGTQWKSLACFEASQDGRITPSTQSPRDGSTYSGTHTMGLFWSLKPERLTGFNLQDDLQFIISFESPGAQMLSDTIIKRSYLNLERNGIVKKEIRDTLVANYFFQEGKIPRPTIVLLAGSGGRLQDQKASYLASKGFNVLDLKYFADKHLPKSLEEVPLEYLKNAIDWLKPQSTTDTSKIALLGRSKGAEYALLYASKYNNIQAVISTVGSSVVWSSKRYIKSSWSYQQKGLPYARGSVIEAVRFLKKLKGTAQNQLPYMLSAFAKTDRMSSAAIEIEKINCPILLLSGKEDMQWPSSMMSEQLITRAKGNNFPYAIAHVAYDNAGHEFDQIPNTPQVDFSSVSTWRSGGDFQGNALASIHSWNKILTFLNDHMAMNQSGNR